MGCAVCGAFHASSPVCERLAAVAQALDLMSVLAFVTDPCNRVVWVNRQFARTVGDPAADDVPLEERFVATMLLGPYSDHFPRRHDEVAACALGLADEVDRGALALPALRLLRDAVAMDERVQRRAEQIDRAWDGTIVVRGGDGRGTAMVHEQVVSIVDPGGRDTGYHVSLWLPVDRPAASDGPLAEPIVGGRAGVSALSPRQLHIARLYATGLTSRGVAARAGITVRTARDHLEAIHQRLGVHSRAELVTRLSRAGVD